MTDVFAIPSGVAVLGRDFWSVQRGRDALVIDWGEEDGFTLGSADILDHYRALAATPGQVARREGDTAAAFATAARVIEAELHVPYLAHAAMEPMSCVIALHGDGCDLYYGAQVHGLDLGAAQMEGGMGFGLGAALKSAITLDGGRVVETNFHDYQVLRMSEMPRVDVHILPSTAPPTGVGEPATPVIAPAVANAHFAATGQRLRSLPLRLDA